MPLLPLDFPWTSQPLSGVKPSKKHVFNSAYVLRGNDAVAWNGTNEKDITPATTTALTGKSGAGEAWKLHATSSAIDLGVSTELSNSAFAALFTITPLSFAGSCRLFSGKYNTSVNWNALDLHIGTDGHPNLSIVGVGNIYDGTGGPALVVGKTSTVIYTWTNAGGTRCFVDGRKHGSAGSSGYTFPAFTQCVSGRLAFDVNETGEFLLHSFAWSNTAQNLPDQVLQDLSANPWQLSEPTAIDLWFGGAGSGTPITLTASISAAIQAARSATASISAAIQQEASLNAGLDSSIQAARTIGAGADAAISAAQSETASVSAAIQQAFSVSAALDAAVMQARSSNASLNGYILAGSVVVASLDAAILQARTVSAGIDATIIATQSVNSSVSASIAAPHTAAAALNAYVNAGFTALASLDAAILVSRSAGAGLNAYISVGNAALSASRGDFTNIQSATRFNLQTARRPRS